MMKNIFLLFTFTLFIGSAFAQVNGKVNGRSTAVINSKGELVCGNKTAADVPLQIKSFSVEFMSKGDGSVKPSSKDELLKLIVTPTQGQNAISKEDMKLIQNAKGQKATIKNITAIDKTGKEVELPDFTFVIE